MRRSYRRRAAAEAIFGTKRMCAVTRLCGVGVSFLLSLVYKPLTARCGKSC